MQLVLLRGGWRRGDDDLRHTRDACGNGAHDQRRDIHRASARNVHAGALQRPHAMDDSFPRIGRRQLREVKRLDACDGRVERVRELAIDRDRARLDEDVGDRNAVEARDLLGGKCIAALANPRDHGVGDAERIFVRGAPARFERAQGSVYFRREWHRWFPRRARSARAIFVARCGRSCARRSGAE
jgi:hypothetical protein